MYNGCTEENIVLELENIADDFECESMTEEHNAIIKAVNAIKTGNKPEDETVFNYLCDGIVKADEIGMYGIGDTLLDIVVALKTAWNIETE